MQDPAQGAAAAYIEEVTGELVVLAQKHQMTFLALLLDMARLEADIAVKGDTRLYAAEMVTPPIQISSIPK